MKKTGFIFIVLLLMTGLSSTSFCQIYMATPNQPMVKVKAKGVISTIPDIAQVSLGVFMVDPDLKKAKKQADNIISRLLIVAQELKVDKKDVSSSSISIEPIYSEANEQEFVGYEISRSVTIILRDLSLLDQVIDMGIQSGANRQFSVSLLSSREKELQDQALNLAIEDAKLQANLLAQGFNSKLGSVYSIYPGERRSYSFCSVGYTFGKGTFEPGTLKFENELSVTFHLINDDQ